LVFSALDLSVGKTESDKMCGWFSMKHNVLALGEEADFEALNCQPSTKFDKRQNVQLTTEPAFLGWCCSDLVI